MSQIYSRLLQAELEKHVRPSVEPPLNKAEEKIVPIEEWLASKPSEEPIEAPAESVKEKSLSEDENGRPLPLLFVELSDRVRSSLSTLRGLADSSQGRFRDQEFGHSFHRMVTEDIEKTESELTCFVDYVKITSPVMRTNMVHLLLDETLKKHERKLSEKKIRIFNKQYERDLPETTVRDEELKYILNWVLQYAINSATSNGGLGFLTRYSEVKEPGDELKPAHQRNGKYVEIQIAFEANGKDSNQTGASLGTPVPQDGDGNGNGNGNGNSFILPLIGEIVQKNSGTLKFKVDNDKHLTRISLMLPSERRKSSSYQ